MSDYISRKAAIGKLMMKQEKTPKGTIANFYNIVIKLCIEVIERIPTADVRENVHGEWEKMDMHRGMEQYKCSECEAECYVPECMGEPMYLFCPNCGADMREETK